MPSITYGQVCDAVATTLGAAAGLVRVESFDELREGLNDLPVLRVWPEAAEGDSFSGRNDRTTFRGGSRVQEAEIVCDVPCRQRSQLDEDSQATVELADQLVTILEAQDTKPYFGLAGIKGFRWRWERTVFQVGTGDGMTQYLGLRLRIWCTLF